MREVWLNPEDLETMLPKSTMQSELSPSAYESVGLIWSRSGATSPHLQWQLPQLRSVESRGPFLSSE